MSEKRETEQNLESELRQTAGREWAEEAAEDERLTELMRSRRMELGQRARELVDSGNRVRVETGNQTFAGQLTYAGTDYAVVDRGDDLVAVRLDSGTVAVEPGTGPPAGQSGAPTSLKAHLAELASTGESLRLIVGQRALIGSIDVVAEDHLVFNQDGQTILVPFRQLVAVVRPKPR